MKRFLLIVALFPAVLIADGDAPHTVDECLELTMQGAARTSGRRARPQTRRSICQLKGALKVGHPVAYNVKAAAIQGLSQIAQAHGRYKEDIRAFLLTLPGIYAGTAAITNAVEAALIVLS